MIVLIIVSIALTSCIFLLIFNRFRVVHSSSEDSGYPSSELNAHSPSTRGWQSDKFCQFPQELGFELVKGESKLSQVQILSHQSKIATKVEIFLGQGHDYHSANFKRLGYLSLDNNERSSYQARELKTVYIDQSGRFIKLLIHKNYVNKQNMFSQVGIVALNLLGSDEEQGYSPGGSSSHSKGNQKPILNNPLNDLSIDMNLDPPTAEKLRLLSDAKV
jgi:centrosomal protein CEP104